MRLLDFRITLFGATFFLRLFCQYPGAFYYLMISATLPRRDLFCMALKKPTKGPAANFPIHVPIVGD